MRVLVLGDEAHGVQVERTSERRPLCTHPHAWADDSDARGRVDANRRWLIECRHRASPMGFMGGDTSREGDRGSASCRDDVVEPTCLAENYFSDLTRDQIEIGLGYGVASRRSRSMQDGSRFE